jgi:hypothetical protein
MTRKPAAGKDLTYSNISYGKALIHSSQFEISTPFQPCGHQAAAIDQLIQCVEDGQKHQVLPGVTGFEKDPALRAAIPSDYQCPLCSCRAGDSTFRVSRVVGAAICEGCDIELSHFLERDEREKDPVLDALEAFTGVSFEETRRRRYREAIAIFRFKLQPENIDREVAEEVKRTKRTAAETIANWNTILRDYEAALRRLEAAAR